MIKIDMKFKGQFKDMEQTMIALKTYSTQPNTSLPSKTMWAIGGYLAKKVQDGLRSQKTFSDNPVPRLKPNTLKRKKDKRILIETQQMVNAISYGWQQANKRLYVGVPAGNKKQALKATIHEFGAIIPRKKRGKYSKYNPEDLRSFLRKHRNRGSFVSFSNKVKTAARTFGKRNFYLIPPRPFLRPVIEKELIRMQSILDMSGKQFIDQINRGKKSSTRVNTIERVLNRNFGNE